MTRIVADWNDAADDVASYFRERSRTFDTKRMLQVVDILAMKETEKQESLLEIFGSPDFLSTVLGHVTTAIHGRGSVPTQDGWYSATGSPPTYRINSLFALAWRNKRRLSPPP